MNRKQFIPAIQEFIDFYKKSSPAKMIVDLLDSIVKDLKNGVTFEDDNNEPTNLRNHLNAIKIHEMKQLKVPATIVAKFDELLKKIPDTVYGKRSRSKKTTKKSSKKSPRKRSMSRKSNKSRKPNQSRKSKSKTRK